MKISPPDNFTSPVPDYLHPYSVDNVHFVENITGIQERLYPNRNGIRYLKTYNSQEIPMISND
ncbi:MAG TPA: hypothetical protein PKC30_04840 [Saprospiraceae bacterium]|nr:hypothetical protein [Saprospiraceae bacterium]